MSGIVLSASVRQNLLSLQSTASLLATTQNDLATGNKVNSALDNPTNFFTAQALNNRASDIGNLLDSIGNGVQVLQAANTGITSLQSLVSSAQSIANQVLQSPIGYSTKSNVTSAPYRRNRHNLFGPVPEPMLATRSTHRADDDYDTTAGVSVGHQRRPRSLPLPASASKPCRSTPRMSSDTSSSTADAARSTRPRRPVQPTPAPRSTCNERSVTSPRSIPSRQYADGRWSHHHLRPVLRNLFRPATHLRRWSAPANRPQRRVLHGNWSAPSFGHTTARQLADVHGGDTSSRCTTLTIGPAPQARTGSAPSHRRRPACRDRYGSGNTGAASSRRRRRHHAETGTARRLSIPARAPPPAALGLGSGTATGRRSHACFGQTLTIGATGGGTATNITFGTGTSQISTLNQLNTALAANNLQASISTTGQINIVTSNDKASRRSARSRHGYLSRRSTA